MLVRYCIADCQRKHWAKHKKECKQRAAELRDEALFKDPPAKEDCPICFLPMPVMLICCVSLQSANISSLPIFDFATAKEELSQLCTQKYYSCCGKNICLGCVHSFIISGNDGKCPFCNSDRASKIDEEKLEEIMKRGESNDAASIYVLANHYEHGGLGLQQNCTKAKEFYARSADLGFSMAHDHLGDLYHDEKNLKKAKFHFEAAAMAGHKGARFDLGSLEFNDGNKDRAIKHWIVAASVGHYQATRHLKICFEKGRVSRESIDSTLAAYNNSCTEMRSEDRDTYIHAIMTYGI
jgi:TPR repeat protein